MQYSNAPPPVRDAVTADPPKGRPVEGLLGREIVTQGASARVCEQLGIPVEWADRCEDSSHTGHDRTQQALETRLEHWTDTDERSLFHSKMRQAGSYGGGNHFGECEVVESAATTGHARLRRSLACETGTWRSCRTVEAAGGVRCWADGQFKSLRRHFEAWDIPLPGTTASSCTLPSVRPKRMRTSMTCRW